MSEQMEDEEQEVTEEEEDTTNPQPGGGTAERPPEDDTEPGSDEEEPRTDRSNPGESTLTPGEFRTAQCSFFFFYSCRRPVMYLLSLVLDRCNVIVFLYLWSVQMCWRLLKKLKLRLICPKTPSSSESLRQRTSETLQLQVRLINR